LSPCQVFPVQWHCKGSHTLRTELPLLSKFTNSAAATLDRAKTVSSGTSPGASTKAQETQKSKLKPLLFPTCRSQPDTMASRNGQLFLFDALPFFCPLPLDLLRRRRVGMVDAASGIDTNLDHLSALATVQVSGKETVFVPIGSMGITFRR